MEGDFLDYFVSLTSDKPKKIPSIWTTVEHLELLVQTILARRTKVRT